ncbi:MAG: hypothetical protein HYY77_12280 [Betaproteobacteria bacterium]|nr:hypothetical protein [Betaproteobacteria bacterium]
MPHPESGDHARDHSDGGRVKTFYLRELAHAREHFRGIVKGCITCYELPKVHAINLVMEGALGGGVTRSLSLDPHGKSYSALILTMPVEVPEDIAAELMLKGRRPI